MTCDEALVDKLLLVQSIITLIVLIIYGILAWSSRPFLSDADDWLDGLSRFTMIATSVLALLTSVVGQHAAPDAPLHPVPHPSLSLSRMTATRRIPFLESCSMRSPAFQG